MKNLITLFVMAILLAHIGKGQQLYHSNYSSGVESLNFRFKDDKGVKKPGDWPLKLIKTDADFWKDKDNTQTQISISTRDLSGTIYTELLHDNIGRLRISFSGALSNDKGDTAKTLNSFLVTGGNATVRLDWPLLVAASKTDAEKRNAGLYLSPKVSGSIPSLGTVLTDPFWNFDLGGEAQFYLSGDNDLLALTGKVRVAYVIASESLSKELTTDGRTTFGYNSVSAGLAIKKSIMILVNTPLSFWGTADPLDKQPVSISVGAVF